MPAHTSPLPGPGVIAYGLRSMFRPASPLYIRASAAPKLAPWLLRFAGSCTDAARERGTRALIALNAAALPAFERLRRTGVTFELQNAGLLYCFERASNVGHALDEIRAMTSYGYAVPDVIEGDAVRRFEPTLSRSVVSAFFVSNECHVDPVALTSALRESAADRGVNIKEGDAVIGFDRSHGRIGAVRTSADAYPVDEVVVAAGAWTGELLRRTLDLSLPIQAGKGYSFTVRPARVPLRPLSFHEARVAVTPAGDRMRLAGTMEFSGLNDRIDPRRIAAIHSSANTYFADGVPTERRDDWAGMRPLLPDGLPVIGRLQRFENLIVATGHGMLGITQGPATGEAVANLVAQRRENAADVTAFSPSRFGV